MIGSLGAVTSNTHIVAQSSCVEPMPVTTSILLSTVIIVTFLTMVYAANKIFRI